MISILHFIKVEDLRSKYNITCRHNDYNCTKTLKQYTSHFIEGSPQ